MEWTQFIFTVNLIFLIFLIETIAGGGDDGQATPGEPALVSARQYTAACVGETVSLQCSVINFPNASIRWYRLLPGRDDARLTGRRRRVRLSSQGRRHRDCNDPRIRIDYRRVVEIGIDYHLTINQVSEFDNGTYICQIRKKRNILFEQHSQVDVRNDRRPEPIAVNGATHKVCDPMLTLWNVPPLETCGQSRASPLRTDTADAPLDNSVDTNEGGVTRLSRHAAVLTHRLLHSRH